MSKLKYKAVIFDFDDTLVDSRVIKWAHHKAVAKKFYNIDLTDEDIAPHWGKPFPTLVSKLYKDADSPEKMIEANISMRSDFLKKEVKGSAEVVKILLNSGIKIGILSAATKPFIIEDLHRLNFPVEKISIVQGAEDTLVHKPDPSVFIPVFSKLQEEGISNKKEVVYVGDSIDDFRAAQGAGIDFIAVTTGLYSRQDFKKNGAKVIIKDITEVVDKII